MTAGAEWQVYKQQVGTCEQCACLCHLAHIVCESLKMKKKNERQNTLVLNQEELR